jgi:hypothetical protein
MMIAATGMIWQLMTTFRFDSILQMPLIFSGGWESPVWRILKALVSGLLVIFCDFGLGFLLIGTLSKGKHLLNPLESLFVAPLLGGVILSLMTLLAGLVGFVRHPIIHIIIIDIMILICIPLVSGKLKAQSNIQSGLSNGRSLIQYLKGSNLSARWIAGCLVPTAVVLILIIPYIFSPEVESDAVRYHLAAPAQWLQSGKIQYLPYQAFSNFPMLGEMHFMLALTGDGESGRLIHFSWMIVCLGLIIAVFKLFNGSGKIDRLSLLPALGFLLIPSVPILSAWCFIDMFMTAYFLGFVLLSGITLIRGFSWSLAVMQALCIGGCISTKYTMLPLTAILGIVWMILIALGPRSGSCRRLAGCFMVIMTGLGGLATGCVWYLRNLSWTGNPFYPLAWGLFKGGEWSEANAAFYMDKAASKGYVIDGYLPVLNRILELIFSPVSTVFYSERFESHYIGLLPLFGLILALALACSLILKRKSGSMRTDSENLTGSRTLLTWLFSCIIVSWVFWFFTYQSNRLLLPTLALVLIAGCIAIRHFRLLDSGNRENCVINPLFRICLIIAVLLNLLFFSGVMIGEPSKRDAIRTGLGFQRPEIYKISRLNYYPAVKWCREHVGKNEKILLVGEHRTFYFDDNVIASDWYDTPQPLPWIRNSADHFDMLGMMKLENIKYIVLNLDELGQYHSSKHMEFGTDMFRPRFTDDEFRRFEEFWTRPELTPARRLSGRKLSIFQIQYPN